MKAGGHPLYRYLPVIGKGAEQVGLERLIVPGKEIADDDGDDQNKEIVRQGHDQEVHLYQQEADDILEDS